MKSHNIPWVVMRHIEPRTLEVSRPWLWTGRRPPDLSARHRDRRRGVSAGPATGRTWWLSGQSSRSPPCCRRARESGQPALGRSGSPRSFESGPRKFEHDNAMTVFAGVETGIIPSVAQPRLTWKWRGQTWFRRQKVIATFCCPPFDYTGAFSLLARTTPSTERRTPMASGLARKSLRPTYACTMRFSSAVRDKLRCAGLTVRPDVAAHRCTPVGVQAADAAS